MQFKNLGAVADVINKINHSATDIKAVEEVLLGLNKAQMITALSASKLSETDIRLILTSQGLEGAELEEAMAAITSSQAHNQLNTKVKGTTNAFKGLALAIKSHPIIAIAAAALTAITFIVQAKKKADEAAEEAAREAEERARKAAESAKELQESIENLADYQKKINNLSDAINNNNTSQAEALTARQQLLEIQKELIKKYGLEKEVINGITDALNGEKDALNGVKSAAAEKWLAEHQNDISEAQDYLIKSKNTWVDWEGKLSNGGRYAVSRDEFKKNYSSEWGSWEEYYREPLMYLERWMKSHFWTEEGYDEYPWWTQLFGGVSDRERNYSEFAIEGTHEEIIDRLKELYNDVETYVEQESKNLTDKQRELYTSLINGISDELSELSNEETYQNHLEVINTAIKNVLIANETLSDSYNKINKAISELEQAGLENNPEAIHQSVENLDSAYSSIIDIINSNEQFSGVKRQALLEYINKLYSSDTINNVYFKDYISQNNLSDILDKVNAKELTREGIKSIFAEFERAGEENLSDSEKEIKKAIDDYISDYNNEWGSINGTVDYSKLLDVMVDLGYLRTDTKKGYDNFSLSTYSEELNELGDQVKTLKDAYDKFMEGKLSDEEIFKLITDKNKGFLELSDYVDDISTGITTVATKKIDDLLDKFSAVDIDALNEQELASYNKLIGYLNQLKTEFSAVALQENKFRKEIEEIQKAIKNVSSSISTLIGFTKEINENGSLSLSSIDTIMTDDTYKSLRPYINDIESMKTAITELANKQKDAYEDLYNAEMYKNDYEAYRAELDKKESQGETYLSKSIKEIQDEIKNIEQQYGVDLTNWDNLSETKTTILQNTNAELLSKQISLINTFKSYYDTDLTNYKNTTAAKAAILDNFRKSEAFAQASKIATEEGNLHMYQGTLYLDGTDAQNKINSVLAASGLTWQDYVQYLNNGIFTSKGNETLQKTLDEIVKAYTITPPDWDKMTANIKNTGGSNSSSSSKNYIDWIERRLKKFAQTTKEVFAKIADYITFNSQNSQLRKAINAIRDEISVNERAYQAYMNEANKIGLASDWIAWIQNGGYSIQDISNLSDDLKDKISRYKELYDQAIDCKNAVDDLRKTEQEYANQMLSNVEKYYSNRINYVNSDAEYYNSLDTDNLFMNKNFDAIRKSYNEQISYTQKEHDDLLNTLNSLVSSGSIKKYNDDWYEWQQKINDCDVSIRNLQKSVRDLASEQFNNIKNNFDNLLNHIEHQGSLLQESINQTEEKGYIVSTKYYNALISNENKNITQLTSKRNKLYDTLQQAIKSGDIQKGSNEWHQMVQEIESVDLAIEQANTSVIKFNNSIREIQWQVFDLLQDRMSQISAESNFLINLMKNDDLYVKKGQGAGQLTNQGLSTMGLHGVNYDIYMAQSNKYAQEILKIDKQLAKDPYNQTLINRRKELLKLQQDMIISANDEKQAIVSMVKDGIELELSSLKELIDKYNESLDKQKDLYDYQKKVKEQTKEIASLEKQMIAFAGDNSEETKAKVQQLKVDLETARENLQETQYDKFVSDSKKLLDDFYNDYETILNQRLDNVDSLISDMINHINSNASTIQQTIVEASNSVGYSISDSMNTILDNKSRLMLWEDVNVSNNNVILAVNNLTNSINRMVTALDNNSTNTIGHYKKYKSGTHTVNYNQMAWTNENGNSEVIIRKSDGAILTPLAKDDMVLNGYATDNLFSIANDPSKFIRDNLFGANQYNGTSNINNVNSNYSVSVDNINLNLPNVKNYEDFFYAAQHDKRFEKMVQAMTVDKLFGGSSLKKYRV